MNLRLRVENDSEQMQYVILAAEWRYWEGVELVASGWRNGGVYLLGCAAEMLMKVAFARVLGGQLYDPVPAFFGRAERLRRRVCPNLQFEAYHRLLCWSWLIRVQRARLSLSVNDPITQRFFQRMRRLDAHWSINLRYRPVEPTDRESQCAYDDVSWLMAHYHRLWRP